MEKCAKIAQWPAIVPKFASQLVLCWPSMHVCFSNRIYVAFLRAFVFTRFGFKVVNDCHVSCQCDFKHSVSLFLLSRSHCGSCVLPIILNSVPVFAVFWKRFVVPACHCLWHLCGSFATQADYNGFTHLVLFHYHTAPFRQLQSSTGEWQQHPRPKWFVSNVCDSFLLCLQHPFWFLAVHALLKHIVDQSIVMLWATKESTISTWKRATSMIKNDMILSICVRCLVCFACLLCTIG